MSSGNAQRGFTYLVALLLIAASGFGLASLAEAWSHARQREKEAELLWIGEQFKQAIALYYQRSPDMVKRYPEKLDDLLEDRRFATPQRYLRRVYVDPMTGKAEWDLIAAPGGGFMGVRSLSNKRPIRRLNGHTASYNDWSFIFEPPSLGRQPTPAESENVRRK